MLIKYLGHSAFEIITKGHTLLLDPFIKHNPKAAHIDIQSLKPDYIMLTHGHEDHVKDAEQIAKKSNAKIISNYEIVTWYRAKGIHGHDMNLGGSWTYGFGKVKYVQAVHSSMLPDGSYGGNAGGFVISNDEGTIYIAGDTALHLDMKLIPMTCGKIDLAILPIGSNYTMDYKDAIIAASFVECKNIIGCHYDTFDYIVINKEQAQNAFTDAGKKLYLPEIGEIIEL
jgi:L-ascorbate metabolism protein UlaG (beta-lactamase superfamily)